MDNVIYAAVYFAVTLGAFLIGKYVCPNIPKTVTDKLGELSEWAAKFVEWAKEFKKDKTGEEKMAAVVEQLKKIADELEIPELKNRLKRILEKYSLEIDLSESCVDILLYDLTTLVGQLYVLLSRGDA